MPKTARLLRIRRAASTRRRYALLVSLIAAACWGCKLPGREQVHLFPMPAPVDGGTSAPQTLPHAEAEVKPIAFIESDGRPPPRVRDFDSLEPWPMSLDEALHTALRNGTVIRSANGRVLNMPETVRTSLDPTAATFDPNFGPEAALSAFDAQLETGLVWNGAGSPINSAFSSSTFGAFSQPETMAKIGLGKRLFNGTQVGLGGVGGYDSTLASGVYAAYGASVRQPLLRGLGSEINNIAGPSAKPGYYGGVWIAQLESSKVDLELERAVRDLVWEVTRTYWELGYAYQNVNTKRAALDHARQTWERERNRVAEQASPSDYEALARVQLHSAEAAYQNAVCGTTADPSGVYQIEVRLRALLSLPMDDGRVIRPAEQPLTAEYVCDWNEAVLDAHARRIELRKQQAVLQKRRLELKAARHMLLPQLDFVGQYRRLADDGSVDAATFGQALDGWQIGVESQHVIGRRRERAALRNAELLVAREQALFDEQQRQVNVELRQAFAELDRAYGVMQTLAAGRDAARISLEAETRRHAAGEAHIERVLEAENRAMSAETAFQRAVTDYNLAFLQLHYARGTLLEIVGVGLVSDADAGTSTYLPQQPSIFAGDGASIPAISTEPVPPPSVPQFAPPPVLRSTP